MIGAALFYRRMSGKGAADGVADRGTHAPGGGGPGRGDRLPARIEELHQDLTRAEDRASPPVIAREEVTRVLGESAAAEPPDGIRVQRNPAHYADLQRWR